MTTIDTYLAKPYWLIDVLPKQVPAGSPGQYFKAEEYFLSRLDDLCRKFAGVLVRLNCYQDFQISIDGETWTTEYSPEDLERLFLESASSNSILYILIQPSDALLTFSGDDHYMTLYGLDGELLDLVRQLASAEGLFVWGQEPILHSL